MKHMTFQTASRSGTSTIEILVAVALLGSAFIGVGQFMSMTKAGLRNRELSTRIAWELQNARERIGTWPLSDINRENIEQLPFSDALAEMLSEPRWQAVVTAIPEPIPTIRVTLELHCVLSGQDAQPDSLTFWIDAAPPEIDKPRIDNPVAEAASGDS